MTVLTCWSADLGVGMSVLTVADLGVGTQMEERLKHNDDQANLYQNRYESASRTVNELKNSVQSLFQKFGCSTPAVRTILGDSGITDTNMLQYLSLIEQRVTEILQVYAGTLVRKGEDVEHLRVALGQAAAAVPVLRVMIAPPSANDEEYEDMEHQEGGDDETDPKPLAKEQLLARVQRTVARKGDSSIFRVPDDGSPLRPRK